MEIGNEMLITAEDLVSFMDSNDMLMHLSIKEAEILLGYMEGHGYMLENSNGKLMRIDLCSDHDNPESEEYTIDDAIDAACEWNYELIQEAKQERENPENFLDFIKKNEHYESLREDEKILDQMFNRTKYGKEINELAEKLADEFIQKIGKQEDVGEAVKSVVDDVTQYGTDKKGMVR